MARCAIKLFYEGSSLRRERNRWRCLEPAPWRRHTLVVRSGYPREKDGNQRSLGCPDSLSETRRLR